MQRVLSVRWCLFGVFVIAAVFALSAPGSGSDGKTVVASTAAKVAKAAVASHDDDPDLLELSATWWQWIYGIKVSENPAFDDTGKFAANDQPCDDVFFLAGSFISGPFTRDITIRRRTAVFFPVATVSWDNVGVAKEDRLTVPELRAQATAGVDVVEDLTAKLNGEPLALMRLTSPTFSYRLPRKDNIYQYFGGTATGTVSGAVSDGYWVYIPSLPKGKHVVTFGATVPGGGYQPDFIIDLTYNITVK